MNVIVFGATGMVGQAALRQALADPAVDRVLVIGRSSTKQSHAKLRELIVPDMFEFLDEGENLASYDACLFCLGVSSVGMSEAEYRRLTNDLTMGWAAALAQANPQMAFLYVSGAGTGGKAMWAQVKGLTESELLALFPNAYMVRLGALVPTDGERPKGRGARLLYAILIPLVPLLRAVLPNMFITTRELGRAMLRAAREHPSNHILEMSDLRALGGAS